MSESQRVWGWPIVLESFLSGMGASAYLVSAVASFMNVTDSPILVKIGALLGAILCIGAILVLIVDLGRPTRAFRAYVNSRSPMTLGTVLLTGFILMALISIGYSFNIFEIGYQAQYAVEAIGSIFALGVIIYPGFLFGVAKNIPFWNTSLLPMLFLVAAPLSGLSILVLVLSWMALTTVTLVYMSTILLIIYAILIFLYVAVTLNSTQSAKEAALLLIRGRQANIFWPGVILVGIIIPLALSLIPIGQSSFASSLASICIIAGGILFRYTILAVGIPLSPRVSAATFRISLESRHH